ncbi:MAG: hypothetical protein ACE5F4_02335, partial [Candidatus Paceibacteria bacterium]
MNDSSNDGALLPAKEVAARFGYTADYVSRLAREGKIAGEKVDGVWFVDPASLAGFIAEIGKKKEEQRERLSAERQKEYAATRTTLRRRGFASVKKVAARFGYTADYVSRLAREGKIAGEKVDGVWFVDPASLAAFVEEAEKEKQLWREYLRDERHQEYEEASQPPTPSRMVVFARTLAATLGAFVFILSFAFGYGLVNGGVEAGKDIVRHAYIGAGEFTYGAPGSFLAWHDRLSNHLADLWIDRDLIAGELAADVRDLPHTTARTYHAVGTATLTSITDALEWYKNVLIEKSASYVTVAIHALGDSMRPLGNVYSAIDSTVRTTTRSHTLTSIWSDLFGAIVGFFGHEPELSLELEGEPEPEAPVFTERVIERTPTTVVQNITET